MKIVLIVLCMYITSCTVVLSDPAEDIRALQKDIKALKKKDKKLTKLINQQKATLTDNQATITDLQTALNALGPANVGTNYVRWGRTVCPTGANVLYKGYVAKTWYTFSGGGGDYQCIDSNPEHPDIFHSPYTGYAPIYGVEYQTTWTFANKDLFNNDAPCAVCVVKRGQKIMIPGKKTCYAGWTMEYTGVLMTSKHDHGQASYICVDKDPEAVPGRSASTDGGLLYHVEIDCNKGASLPCPPFKGGVEVSCVVCTQ